VRAAPGAAWQGIVAVMTGSQNLVALAEREPPRRASGPARAELRGSTALPFLWGFEAAPFRMTLRNGDLRELADPASRHRVIATADVHDEAGRFLRRTAVRVVPEAIPTGVTRGFDDSIEVKLFAGDYELRFGLHLAETDGNGGMRLRPLAIDTQPVPIRVKNAIFEMFVELVNACNFRCTFCPQGELVRKQQPMDFDLATKIVKDLAEMGHHHPIRTHLLGEPLLYKRFTDFVDMAHDHGQRVYLATNGSRFTPGIIDGILGCRLDEMLISLNTPEEALYNEQRGTRVPYSEYIDGINRMVTALVQRGGPPKTRINVLYDRSKKDDPAEIARVRRIVDEWIDVARKASGADLPRADEVVHLEPTGTTMMRLYDGIEMQWNCYHNWGEGRSPDFHFCSFPWRQLGVFVDGQATTCCVDAQGEIDIGNARTQSIAEIWDGPKLQEIRAGFLRGQALEPRCVRCDVYHDKATFFPDSRG
jgi:MoaA/NifB/PqqE/SkfB family radical SAM enzyme